MKYAVLAVLAVLIIIIAVVLIRTLSLKPTKAKDATMPVADEKRSDEYSKKLSEMVKINTVSDRDNFDVTKFTTYHKKLRELFPLVFDKLEVTEIDGNLIAKWKGKTDGDAVLLMSHQDVVPEGDNWTHDPFGGEIKDGVIWGRGTMDTKCSACCFLQAVEELLAEGYEPDVDIYLAGSCTEEISGDGAPKTVAWLKEKDVKLALVLDEGGAIMDKPVGGVNGTYAMVGVLEKGYGDLKFTARSNGGHASAPSKGTAWARLGMFIADVEKKDPFVSKFNDTSLEMFRRYTPNMDFGMRMVFSNMWLFKGLLTKVIGKISPQGGAMLKTTLAFTKGKGSDGYNVLPMEAYVTANMRFINHQPTDESIALISKIASKYDIETEVLTAKQPSEPISYTSDAFHLVENAIAEVFPGIDTVPYIMTGGTDAKFYEEICDNCLRFYPFHLTKQQHASMHAADENISCNTLPLAVDFYKYIIKNGKDA